MPRYDLALLRRVVIRLGASLGLPQSTAALWARALLWNEVNGFHEYGMASLPSDLKRIEERQIDPHEIPWLSPLPNGEGFGLHASRALPALVLARASETASQLARSRRSDGLGVVRIWGLDPGTSAAAEVADLALGPFVAAAFGSRNSVALAWPTRSGLPLLYNSAIRPVSTQPDHGLPPFPHLPPGHDGEFLILARAIQPGDGLARAHESIDPYLDHKIEPKVDGFLHPDRLRQNRDQAEGQGLGLPGPVAAALVDWSRRQGVPPPRPIDEPEDPRSW